jgi:hypothetical protein
MSSRRGLLGSGAALLGANLVCAQARREVDLALILAIDCSLSIDANEYRLQIDGTASAIEHPTVVRAVTAGEKRGIALACVQWAAPREQVRAINWSLIDDAAAALRFAATLRRTPRPFSGDATAIGAAIDFCRPIFDVCPYPPARRAIDISSDGINNAGRFPVGARDEAVGAGITINGLPILSDIAGLDGYFREEVVGGPGSFVVSAPDFAAFAAAMRAKLVREVS